MYEQYVRNWILGWFELVFGWYWWMILPKLFRASRKTKPFNLNLTHQTRLPLNKSSPLNNKTTKPLVLPTKKHTQKKKKTNPKKNTKTTCSPQKTHKNPQQNHWFSPNQKPPNNLHLLHTTPLSPSLWAFSCSACWNKWRSRSSESSSRRPRRGGCSCGALLLFF